MAGQQGVGGGADEVGVDALHVAQDVEVEGADFGGVDLAGLDLLQVDVGGLGLDGAEARFLAGQGAGCLLYTSRCV